MNTDTVKLGMGAERFDLGCDSQSRLYLSTEHYVSNTFSLSANYWKGTRGFSALTVNVLYNF